MTLFVDIDILGSRFLGKSRHSHDFPCNRYDKTCSGGNFYLAELEKLERINSSLQAENKFLWSLLGTVIFVFWLYKPGVYPIPER